MASIRHNDFSLNTIIGPGSYVYGNMESSGFTRVDGNVLGDIKAQGKVVIGEGARMKSNISGTSITIGGVVYGNVLASEGLVILASGLVRGNIITRRIRADDGCFVHGHIKVCQTEEAWDKAVSEHREILAFTKNHG
jgi:cytoskeletal protein CcmA (bactofilin family)